MPRNAIAVVEVLYLLPLQLSKKLSRCTNRLHFILRISSVKRMNYNRCKHEQTQEIAVSF